MSRTRRFGLLVGVGLALGGLATYILGSPTIEGSRLGHGVGYADCPISLDLAGPDAVAPGGTVQLIGQLVPEPGADVADESIAITRNPVDTDDHFAVTTATTDDDGFFTASFTLSEDSNIRARWAGTGSCEAMSSAILVLIQSFLDVPPEHFAFEFVEKLVAAGITAGCDASPPLYCPNSFVSRGQMAVFMLRAMGHGSPSHLPAFRGIFADVPSSHPFARYIEHLFDHGVTSGCDTSPRRYCPGSSVTRGQMAVFILRGIGHGSPSHLPAFRGIFADVPSSNIFARSIEHLYDHGVTAGCRTSPLRYCPDSRVTRAQMAVFIVRAFGL